MINPFIFETVSLYLDFVKVLSVFVLFDCLSLSGSLTGSVLIVIYFISSDREIWNFVYVYS